MTAYAVTRSLTALDECGAERVAYETAKIASGRYPDMRWLDKARRDAEANGWTLEEVDAHEADMLALENENRAGDDDIVGTKWMLSGKGPLRS